MSNQTDTKVDVRAPEASGSKPGDSEREGSGLQAVPTPPRRDPQGLPEHSAHALAGQAERWRSTDESGPIVGHPQKEIEPHVSAANAAGIFAEGSRFGVYVVGPCIGHGGMARIYRAEHEGLRRQVALKVLTDGFAQDGEGRQRFLREARIAAAIKHPNVVNIFDVGVQDGIPYLVMELLEGEDLEALLHSSGCIDEGTIIDIIVPVVAGLAAVHDAGVVHRDLKPGNIFLATGRNDETEPKLLDFGISKAAGHDQLKLTSATKGLLMGTPFYMSPEAIQGADMTPLSDQYSLGVMLYECVTGTNPFSAGTFAEMVRRITSGEYPPLSEHSARPSRRLVRIIERAMSLNPADRFPDMRALGRELLSLAGQRTRITWGLSFGQVVAPGLNPDGAIVRASAPGQGDAFTNLSAAPRSRLTWVASAIGFIAFAAAAVLFFYPRGRSAVATAPAQMTSTASGTASTEQSAVLTLRGTKERADDAPPLRKSGSLREKLAAEPTEAEDSGEQDESKSDRRVADAVSEALRNNGNSQSSTKRTRTQRAVAKAPKRRQRVVRRVARRRTSVAKKKAKEKEAAEVPVWAEEVSSGSARSASSSERRGPLVGTNRAPIFD